jgi:hypothetical protein
VLQRWLQNNAKITADAELAATITPAVLEGVFDLLEKNTGFSDPVPLVCGLSVLALLQ